MTEAELRAAIKRGPTGGYLLWGEEDYLKRYYLAEIRRAVLSDCPAGLAELNRAVVTLEDGDCGALAQAILSLPVMAEKKIVEIVPPSLDGMKEKERRALTETLALLGDAPETVVVFAAPRGFDAGTPKRPTALFRALTAVLVPVECPFQTGLRLRRWIERHFADEGLTITEADAEAMLARCAPDMTGLSGELEKLIAYEKAHGRREVTAEDIFLVTSPGIREDGFALVNAVLEGDRRSALAALDGYRKRREDPIMILSSLEKAMSDLMAVCSMAEAGMEKAEIAHAMKMHEYKAQLYMRYASEFGSARLRAALARVIEADRLSKTLSLGYIPLERFVCTIPIGAKFRKKPEGTV